MIWFIGDTEAHYDGVAGTPTHIYSNISLGTPVARIDRTADTTPMKETVLAQGTAPADQVTVYKRGDALDRRGARSVREQVTAGKRCVDPVLVACG